MFHGCCSSRVCGPRSFISWPLAMMHTIAVRNIANQETNKSHRSVAWIFIKTFSHSKQFSMVFEPLSGLSTILWVGEAHTSAAKQYMGQKSRSGCALRGSDSSSISLLQGGEGAQGRMRQGRDELNQVR
jgi:hypothetical protein